MKTTRPLHLTTRSRILLLAVVLSSALALWSVVALSGTQSIAAADGRSLRICVDVSSISIAGPNLPLTEALGRLERVMRTHVERHSRYASVGYRPGAWSITEGCPIAPTLLTSGGKALKNGGAPSGPSPVTVPSGFDLFVFVVTQTDMGRMFGDLPYQVAGQEVMCKNDSCGDISNAWYVTPETLLRSDEQGPSNPVARGLLMGIGLDPVLPETPRVGPQHK